MSRRIAGLGMNLLNGDDFVTHCDMAKNAHPLNDIAENAVIAIEFVIGFEIDKPLAVTGI